MNTREDNVDSNDSNDATADDGDDDVDNDLLLKLGVAKFTFHAFI